MQLYIGLGYKYCVARSRVRLQLLSHDRLVANMHAAVAMLCIRDVACGCNAFDAGTILISLNSHAILTPLRKQTLLESYIFTRR